MNPYLTLTDADHGGLIFPDAALSRAVTADQQGRIAEDVALELACIQLDMAHAEANEHQRQLRGRQVPAVERRGNRGQR